MSCLLKGSPLPGKGLAFSASSLARSSFS